MIYFDIFREVEFIVIFISNFQLGCINHVGGIIFFGGRHHKNNLRWAIKKLPKRGAINFFEKTQYYGQSNKGPPHVRKEGSDGISF